MDKKSAQNLIRETFQQPFDKTRFTIFIKNLLNELTNRPIPFMDDYSRRLQDLCQSYERLGKYEDGKIKLIF